MSFLQIKILGTQCGCAGLLIGSYIASYFAMIPGTYPEAACAVLALSAAYWWIALVAFIDQWFDLEIQRVAQK